MSRTRASCELDPPVSALAEHSGFLRPGVSVIAASRNARLVPSVTRGVAVRVSKDLRSLIVLLRATQAGAVLADVAASGLISTCHSLPTTHRTLQFKGADARIESAEAGDVALAAAFANGFCQQLVPMGYAEAQVRAMLHCEAGDLVAVRFTPAQIFGQTPGPNAGQRLS